MSDKFFNQLLQYREKLLSREFVEDLMNVILRFERTRTLIILAFTITGLIFLSFADISIINLINGINFEPLVSELESISTETISAAMFAILCTLGFWLITLEQ